MTESEAIKELHKIRPRGGIIPQKRAEAIDAAINALEEIEQYKALGTVDELRLAKEKQIPKKPVNYDKHYYKCPCCNKDLEIDDDILFVYGEEPPKFCIKCGQKLNWESGEE